MERVIIFGNKDRINLFKNNDYKEYFIDVTFKIIPKKYRPYKLMTIASINYLENKTVLICFILLKFLDKISYYKIFQYLHENLSFNPTIIHTDYEGSLASAIKEARAKFFTNEIIHIRCIFHFMQAVRAKCNKLGLCKKKLNKELYVVLKNIELICLIDSDNIKKYKDFLLENLNKKEKYKSLSRYLKNYWFKKPNNIYNFSEFFKKFKGNKKYLDKIYLTNNIVESIHGKLNYYLPKHITNSFNFINAINNIFVNDVLNNNNIIRHDFKTKALLLLIENENINNNFKWISYEQFKYYLNKVIKGENDNILENEVEKFIKIILIDDLESYNENLNKDNNSLISNNIHIISDNSDEDKISSNENDEKDKIDSINEDSEELNDIIDSDEDIQNIDNLEKFIKQFDDLKVSVNQEKNNEVKDIIDNSLLLPLNKRIEKRISISNKNNEKKIINYPKKRKHDGLSNERRKKSCSKKKKKGWK